MELDIRVSDMTNVQVVCVIVAILAAYGIGFIIGRYDYIKVKWRNRKGE